MLQGVLNQLGVKQPTLLSAGTGSAPAQSLSSNKALVAKTAHKTLRRVAFAVQFMVRVQRSADSWARQEAARQRLADAAEGMRKAERMQKMRTEWRKQLATVASGAIRQ